MATGERFIEFVIKPDGKVEMEMEGFEGQGCAEEAAEMIKKLGRSIEDKKLAEYYQMERKQTCATNKRKG